MYDSSFIVSEEAISRALLTPQDVELALGDAFVTDSASLKRVILQASDLIASECLVPRAGVTPPTLRSETIVETFRLQRDYCALYAIEPLVLSRRPVSCVTSIFVDGVEVDEADYELRAAAGQLIRLNNDTETEWTGRKIVVTYEAGWDVVPEDLKLAAIRVVQEQVSASQRDPLLRGETIEGIGRFDYWVNSTSSPKSSRLSPTVSAMLDPFRYCSI